MHALTAEEIERVEAEIDYPLSRKRLVESLVQTPQPPAERRAEPSEATAPVVPSPPGDPGWEPERKPA